MWPLILAATIVGGFSEADVILVNDTGLQVARVEIDERKIEAIDHYNKLLIAVTPVKHHLRVVFRGGADVDWKHLDFQGVHEIIFERVKNKIQARLE